MFLGRGQVFSYRNILPRPNCASLSCRSTLSQFICIGNLGKHATSTGAVMTSATQQVEITVREITEPATLGRLMAIAVSCGADVLTACSCRDGVGRYVKLVTRCARRTEYALRGA